jgi:hypothetical protein
VQNETVNKMDIKEKILYGTENKKLEEVWECKMSGRTRTVKTNNSKDTKKKKTWCLQEIYMGIKRLELIKL